MIDSELENPFLNNRGRATACAATAAAARVARARLLRARELGSFSRSPGRSLRPWAAVSPPGQRSPPRRPRASACCSGTSPRCRRCLCGRPRMRLNEQPLRRPRRRPHPRRRTQVPWRPSRLRPLSRRVRAARRRQGAMGATAAARTARPGSCRGRSFSIFLELLTSVSYTCVVRRAPWQPLGGELRASAAAAASTHTDGTYVVAQDGKFLSLPLWIFGMFDEEKTGRVVIKQVFAGTFRSLLPSHAPNCERSRPRAPLQGGAAGQGLLLLQHVRRRWKWHD